jgi:hypothetical protein
VNLTLSNEGNEISTSWPSFVVVIPYTVQRTPGSGNKTFRASLFVLFSLPFIPLTFDYGSSFTTFLQIIECFWMNVYLSRLISDLQLPAQIQGFNAQFSVKISKTQNPIRVFY